MDIFFDLGSFILVEDYYLLNDVFGDFEFGEYVGYQFYDLSFQLNKGVVMFIYVMIIEEVMVQDVGCNEDWVLYFVIKVYLVNIGEEYELVEVIVVKLYKFCCFEEIFNGKCRNREDWEEVFF